MLHKFFQEEEGQSLVEYGMLISLIALFVLGVVAVFGGKVSKLWGNNAENFPNLPPEMR